MNINKNGVMAVEVEVMSLMVDTLTLNNVSLVIIASDFGETIETGIKVSSVFKQKQQDSSV